MNPHRLITAELLDRLEIARLKYPPKHRPGRLAVQNVLRYVVGWSRMNADGRVFTETLAQIATGTGSARSVVSRCLTVLEVAGVAEVVARGGSSKRLGSRRRLHLDDVTGATDRITDRITECLQNPHEFGENPHEFAENPHEFRRELVRVSHTSSAEFEQVYPRIAGTERDRCLETIALIRARRFTEIDDAGE